MNTKERKKMDEQYKAIILKKEKCRKFAEDYGKSLVEIYLSKHSGQDMIQRAVNLLKMRLEDF